MSHTDPRPSLDAVQRAFSARAFDEAARAAEALIASASPGPSLERAADALLSSPGLQPIFRNAAEQRAAGPFFQRVYVALEQALGPDDVRVAQYRTRVALIASNDGDDRKAAALLTTSLDTLRRVLGTADPRTSILRSQLAILHRNANEPALADALFSEVELCEHLRPLVADLRGRGVHVLDVTRPWSANCRDWMYFADVVLDVDALRARLHLPASVEIHRHRGTVDGAEQGLVCSIDHDGVMGLHPDLAPAGTRVMS